MPGVSGRRQLDEKTSVWRGGERAAPALAFGATPDREPGPRDDDGSPATRLEEAAQERGGLVGQDAAEHLGAVV